ncbi:MAG: glycosyltransferase family 4 protein, partial [Caldiserica bacterium]|nr:glycosyltransferase family 4 protein [Caldisericota bacterium]
MKKTISIIHYSSPPVVGGVEFVIEAQARYLLSRGFEVKIVVGRGENFLPGIKFVCLPEMYSLHREVVKVQETLKKGKIEPFRLLKERLQKQIEKEINDSETIIYHNCLTMPFNIALTAACHSLMGNAKKNLIWIHDSPLFDPFYNPLLDSIRITEYPWNLLTDYSTHALYITITEERKKQAINILGIPEKSIKVIPNGIEVAKFLSLSPTLASLLKKINAIAPDYVALLPARLIRRKNIEMGIRIIKEMNRLDKKVVLLITAPADPHRAEKAYR